MSFELHAMLARVQRRACSVRLGMSLAGCWLAWACVAAMLAAAGWPENRTAAALTIGSGALATAMVSSYLAFRSTRDPRWVARRIEARHPDLGTGLLAAVQLSPTARHRRLGYLQSSVVRSAVDHGRKTDWTRAVSPRRIMFAQLANLTTLLVLIGACAMLISAGDAKALVASPGRDVERSPTLPAGEVEIEPGDVELERGTPLLVVARFGEAPPDGATLVLETSDNAPSASGQPPKQSIRPMTRSLDDPTFVARAPNISHDLNYHVAFAGQRTRTFRVTVFDFPALERADVELHYPEFTNLDSRNVEDTRRVTAVEGTVLTVRCRLNKDVDEAHLVDGDGQRIALAPSDDGAHVVKASWTLERSQRLKLHLTDADGRENKFPPELIVTAIPNKRPTIKITRPARDVRVSPLEELDVAAAIEDDFGTLRAGLAFSLGADPMQEVVLHSSAEGAGETAKKIDVGQIIDMETLRAEPDQLLTYHFWAEDGTVAGSPRRTVGDLYFAEGPPVRRDLSPGRTTNRTTATRSPAATRARAAR